MKTSRRSRKKPPQVNQEWVLGRVKPPIRVEEQGGYSPEILLVLEEFQVVGLHFSRPGETLDVRALLELTMEKPAEGASRRPMSFRLENPELEQEIREAFPDIPVTLAPTPELDAALVELQNHFEPEEDDSYTRNGIIPEPLLREHFKNAKVLYHTAPWTTMSDSDILRVDIEQAGIEGAWLVVMGNAGLEYGIVFFPTYKDYESFTKFSANPEKRMKSGARGKKIRTLCLALNLVKATELSTTKRKEAAKEQWPVASPDAYPRAQRMQNDFEMVEPSQEDIALLTMLSGALSTFYERNSSLFETEELEPHSEIILSDGIGVHFTYPPEAYDYFMEDEAPEETFELHTIGFMGRKPRYPVIINIGGVMVAGKNARELSSRVSKIRIREHADYGAIDGQGDGWVFHSKMGTLSPFQLDKKMTKRDLIQLYNQRQNRVEGAEPYSEKSLNSKRMEKIISEIYKLLHQEFKYTV